MSRFWAHIMIYQEVEHVEPLTKKNILEFFNQFIYPSSSTRAKLSIHLIAQASNGYSAAVGYSAAGEENVDASALRRNQDDAAVIEHKRPVSPATIPVDNVRKWKASLPLSPAATPVKGLAEFEGFGSKS
ncbi:uncharacterized protein BO88DRAFT_414297 [Aspergillus vadensis CBS 113365]|uniref:Uncharacterized protein n=1 Tax=Aspergillus vadensis (strain CBS 113365 / IMI 142717 / IBT 24658) TaxID=1448311 RepID=A0A319BCQ0_ASPVC|nr:hypothetical protein BO88DRAFT_414297 [Aspergillus vadensis CBS 113365]PYH69811.1 hypothetical protein BO88DRAFT_414297 [Aspergillus vadensis CBS 113365]